MTESLTPEDRLRKYKEFISGLANDSDSRSRSPVTNTTTSRPKKSPVKKELIAALAVLKQTKEEEDPPPTKGQSARKNVMLRIKEKALESSMLEIRDEKRRLVRKLEKGEISKLQYEAEIQKLVRRGKSVLKAQSIVAAKKNGSD
ncbi:MAG: hypothetical protein ACXABV_13420 [Candidatus Thorarchaeota archaeon]|jgi:hypothetical protein